MQIWLDVADFAIKTFLIVMAVGSIAILVAVLVVRAKAVRDLISVDNINRRFSEMELTLSHGILSHKAFKALAKKKKKKKSENDEEKKRVYVLSFDGDIKASGAERLRDEVTAILTVARPGKDEVVLKLESPGGLVPHYGIAATQLLRLRDRSISLTICIDKVAASGGYLMACTGEKILAAPFAIVGSIGVIAQVPNVHRLLKKNNIDFEEITAGEYKRTLTVMGEITEKGKAKFKEKIEATHDLFKSWVHTYRPKLNMDEVANGDYWYGRQAIELGLIDEIISSDDYLFRMRDDSKIFKIEIHQKKKLSDRLAENFSHAVESTVMRLWQTLSGP